MKNLIIVSLFAAFTLTACVVSPGPGEYGGVEVSPLPAVVVLGDDPYYYQDGYFYYYHNNNWSYSQSRNGPWAGLPRSHWPNEVRHRDRDKDWDRDRKVMASPLPPVVVLGNDPYYYQDGFFYYYHKNKWRYSQTRNGTWADLPKSYWPKEVRHRDWDRDWDRDKDKDKGRDDDRGRGGDDNRDRDKGHDHDGR